MQLARGIQHIIMHVWTRKIHALMQNMHIEDNQLTLIDNHWKQC